MDDTTSHTPEPVFQRFTLLSVQGVPLLRPIAEAWEPVEDFKAKPDDIVIATYPKAGTTWTQEIVDCIMNVGDLEKTKRAPTHIRSPFLEICALPPLPSDLLENTPSPRLVKTHLPYQLMPKSFWEQKCKWAGEVWFDHVIGWWNAKDKHQILYIFYEDMKEDPKQEIRKVMKFLEKDLPEEVVEKIYQHTSFKAMKENPMANYSTFPTAIFDQTTSLFRRKGEVADWMNHFTDSQNGLFDAEYEKKMSGTDLAFRCNI